MSKAFLAALLILLVSVAIGIYFYPRMPEVMASHWGINGEVNGYTSKFWGLFLVPIISTGLFLLFISIPIIDPLKQNIQKFRPYYDWFIVMILAFLFYIHMLTLLWNLGLSFNFVQVLVPAYALLIYSIGILLGKARRNWFIGIRTPWTIANEQVWNQTHKLGGRLFRIGGFVTLLGVIFPSFAFYFLLVPIIAIAILLVVYSYVEYQKLEK